MSWLACARCGRSIVADLDLCFAVQSLHADDGGTFYLWDKRDVPEHWIWGEDPEFGMPLYFVPDTEPLHEHCAGSELCPVDPAIASWQIAWVDERMREATWDDVLDDDDLDALHVGVRPIETVETGGRL